TLVAVQELLPEPGCRGVRSVLVDRLEVVAADERIGRYEHLPGRNLLGLGRIQVVPVDDDGRLTGFDGRGRRIDRHEVACVLEPYAESDSPCGVLHRTASGHWNHR